MGKMFITYFCILLGIQLAHAENKGFILIAPSRIGSEEKICVSFTNTVAKNLIVNVLEHKSDVEIASAQTFILGSYGCLDIRIPHHGHKLARLEAVISNADNSEVTKSTRTVHLIQESWLTFLSTDKPIYGSNDVVRIRAFIVDRNLLPLSDKVDKLWVENPQGVHVLQESDLKPTLGLIDTSFKLINDPLPGKWKVIIKKNGFTTVRTFNVQKHIIPSFNVSIIAPRTMEVNTHTEMTICAKHTFGKPVQGSVRVEMSVNCAFEYYCKNNLPPFVLNMTLNAVGCARENLMADRTDGPFLQYVALNAFVEELGTGVIGEKSTKIVLLPKGARSLIKGSFKMTTNTIKPGLPFLGNFVLTSDMKKWKSVNVTLCRSFDNEKVCTDQETFDGVVPFTIPPGKSAEKIQLEAFWTNTDGKNSTSVAFLRPWISPSHSYAQLFHKWSTLSCNMPLKIVLLHTLDIQQEFIVMVKSRGNIVLFRNASSLPGFEQGEYEWDNLNRLSLGAPDGNQAVSYISFILETQPNWSPEAALVVFATKDREIVADSTVLRFDHCFPFSVNAEWNVDEAQPGDDVVLQIKTEPNAMCAVSAVDSKVHLLEENASLKSRIFQELSKRFKLVNPDDLALNQDHCVKTSRNFRESKELSVEPTSIFSDSLEAFESTGFVVMSDLNLVSRPCSFNEIEPRNLESANLTSSDTRNAGYWEEEISNQLFPEEPILTFRTEFPDIFLWYNFLTGNETTKSFNHRLPGTITDWTSQVVCLAPEKGLSISNFATIRSFQEFFVDFSLPSSVHRHERIHLAVSVFNYMNTSAPIMLTIVPSKNFHIRENLKTAMCVPANEKLVHVFQLVAVKLGSSELLVRAEIDPHVADECGPVIHRQKIDIVKKSTVVRPEGEVVEEIQSGLICSNNFENGQQPNETEWNIRMSSPDYVPDSISCQVRISGDIFGTAVFGIDNLINKPTGCGEQTATMLIINRLFVEYLTMRSDSDPAIQNSLEKNYKAILEGYQELLNFRHPDGSFSAFGPESNSESSMWLTAFVLPILNHGFDHKMAKTSIQWVLDQQLENGCFPKIGDVYHWDAKTKDSPIALTAFIIISLLNAGLSPNHPSVKNALICVQTPYQETDRYTELLTVYSLALAQEKREASSRMRKLLKEAQRSYNTLWWEEEEPATIESSIEMTSYGILALIEIGNPDFLSSAAYALRWIVQFQNNNGGFISTQDTLVALKAMTQFSKKLPVGKTGLQIGVKYSDTEQIVDINAKNLELLNSFEIPPFTTKIQFKAEGTGCALVQTAIKYNVRKMKSNKSLKIHLRVEPLKGFSIQQVEACMKTGPMLTSTSMAILEINLPSGFYPDRASLYHVTETHKAVEKFEEFEDHVNFYLNKLTNTKRCVSFIIRREICVENPSPLLAKIYDYYNSNYSAVVRHKIQQSCSDDTNLDLLPNALRKRRDLTAFSNFRDVSHDLEAPNEIGNGFQIYAMPPMPGKGNENCPRCLDDIPALFPKLYCSSQVAAQIRFRSKNLLNVMKDVSPQSNFTKIQRNVAFSIKQNCSCDLISSGSKVLMLVTPPRTFNLRSIQIFHIDENITLMPWKTVVRFIDHIAESPTACIDILTNSELKKI